MAAAAAPEAPTGKLLPELRADLQVAGARDGIVIFDPLRQRYHHLDRVAAELLRLWPSCRSMEELAEAADVHCGHRLQPEQLDAFHAFLLQNELAIGGGESWRRLAATARRAHPGWLSSALHNYLFVRISLVRPQRTLTRIVPHLDVLYGRPIALLIAAIGTVAAYLVSRQWDEFTTTFSNFASLEGAIIFAIAIAVVKSLHELGHAVTAVRYGCRVPAMGVCFMLLVPMLYTDVSDAWRLTSRRQRFAIDAAGMAVELAIACVAALAWVFLPDGLMRSVAFALATTGFLMSLAINLNPFMRFDGYYILSDLTGIDNLQPRAFAIARWRLREILFALRQPPPEQLARATLRWLTVYAWLTWAHYFFLFLGIALVVYQIGFKLLGVTLFLVEIVYFILRPVWAELREWHRMRAAIVRARRGLYVAAACAAAVGAAFVPLSTTVLVPALIEDRNLVQVFPARAGVVVERGAAQGDRIEAGGLILAMASPELDHEIRLAKLRRDLVTRRLARTAGDRVDRASLLVLEQSLASLKSKVAGLEKERAELRVTAPAGGTIVEMPPDLHAGRWLARNELLARLAANEACTVRGYVSEADVARIDLTTIARFVPENTWAASHAVRLEQVAVVGTRAMDLIELSSHYGGSIAARSVVRPGEPRSQVPVSGQFLLSGEAVARACAVAQSGRGMLHVSARPESLAARLWRRILQVAVRESGLQ